MVIGKDGIIDMIEFIVLQLMRLQYVVLGSENFITENIVKISFSLPQQIFILKNTKAYFGKDEKTI